MKKALPKSFEEMNARELAAATREFDAPFAAMDRARPLSAAQREQHRRAAERRRGRPQIGKGSERINVTVERDLLRAADALAKSTGKKRSQLFAEGLRLLLKRKAS